VFDDEDTPCITYQVQVGGAAVVPVTTMLEPLMSAHLLASSWA
jgi:hypothetical protein